MPGFENAIEKRDAEDGNQRHGHRTVCVRGRQGPKENILGPIGQGPEVAADRADGRTTFGAMQHGRSQKGFGIGNRARKHPQTFNKNAGANRGGEKENRPDRGSDA